MFQSSDQNLTPSANLVVNKPSGVVSGWILIYVVSCDSGGAESFTFPSGFTQITGSPMHMTAVDGQELAVAIKIAGGSEPASYQVDSSPGNPMVGFIAAWSNGISTQPQRSSTKVNGGAAGTPMNVASVAFGANTTTLCDVVFVADVDDATAGDWVWTAPSGFTKQLDLNNSGPGKHNLVLCFKDSQSSGYNGVETAIATLAGHSADWAAAMIALELIASFTAKNDGVSDQQLFEEALLW